MAGGQISPLPLTFIVALTTLSHYRASVMGKSSSRGIPTFSAEMAGAKALWLCIQIPKAAASARSNFGASLWWVIDIFDEFSQKARKLIIFILWGKESFF